jgi:hypothetical protein
MAYCPKEDKSAPIAMETVSSTRRHLTGNYFRVKCPNFMSGQRLRLGHTFEPGRKVVDGILVPTGSFSAMVFLYLSQKFQFTPEYVFGRSLYIANNDTWLGNQGEVGTVSSGL